MDLQNQLAVWKPRVAIALVCVAAPLSAQGRTAGDSAAIVAAEHRWAEANVACDTTMMSAVLSDSLVFVHTDGAADGKRAYLMKVAGCQVARVDITPTAVHILGDVAVVDGSLRMTFKGRESNPAAPPGTYSRVYVRTGSGWVMFAHHSTKITLNPASTSLVAQSHVATGPRSVDITWMSVTNMLYEFNSTGILTDGYISRVPQSLFVGGPDGLRHATASFPPDTAAVRRVLDAIGGPRHVTLLLTGHSHFDHSLDTPTWARLTGAPIIGSKTTCLQVRAFDIPASQCRTVVGGERIQIADGVAMYVVRFNHSGNHEANPMQHDPRELSAVPKRDPMTGGLRPGVGDDYPNGGGNRAFLFVVDGPDGRYSWFFNNSASAADLAQPIIVDGVNYGAPLSNLQTAMKDAGLESVNLWIGAPGADVAKLMLPVLRPKAFLPVHWDNFYQPFNLGVTEPFASPALEALLMDAGVELVRPAQYMDKWRLDRTGIRAVPNSNVKRTLGFLAGD